MSDPLIIGAVVFLGSKVSRLGQVVKDGWGVWDKVMNMVLITFWKVYYFQ